uniref:Mucin-2-like n=1 Tax=Xenopus tropicalis TaxID=8364 RepID=A0A803JTT1_XENTR
MPTPPDLESHHLSLLTAQQDVLSDRSSTDWAVFAYEKRWDLKLLDSGAGGLEELTKRLNARSILYGLCQVTDPNSKNRQVILIHWEASVFLSARRLEDLTPDVVAQALSKEMHPGVIFPRSRYPGSSEVVGTNYRKTNPAVEMRFTKREAFWQRSEREEERRKEKERQRLLEEKIALERQRVERERLEEQHRELRIQEKERLVEEQRKEQARFEAEQRKREKDRWMQQQKEHEEEMKGRFKRSQSIEMAAEAAILVSHRSMHPREFFRQQERSVSCSYSPPPTPTSPSGSGAFRRPAMRYQRSLTETIASPPPQSPTFYPSTQKRDSLTFSDVPQPCSPAFIFSKSGLPVTSPRLSNLPSFIPPPIATTRVGHPSTKLSSSPQSINNNNVPLRTVDQDVPIRAEYVTLDPPTQKPKNDSLSFPDGPPQASHLSVQGDVGVTTILDTSEAKETYRAELVPIKAPLSPDQNIDHGPTEVFNPKVNKGVTEALILPETPSEVILSSISAETPVPPVLSDSETPSSPPETSTLPVVLLPETSTFPVFLAPETSVLPVLLATETSALSSSETPTSSIHHATDTTVPCFAPATDTLLPTVLHTDETTKPSPPYATETPMLYESSATATPMPSMPSANESSMPTVPSPWETADPEVPPITESTPTGQSIDSTASVTAQAPGDVTVQADEITSCLSANSDGSPLTFMPPVPLEISPSANTGDTLVPQTPTSTLLLASIIQSVSPQPYSPFTLGDVSSESPSVVEATTSSEGSGEATGVEAPCTAEINHKEDVPRSEQILESQESIPGANPVSEIHSECLPQSEASAIVPSLCEDHSKDVTVASVCPAVISVVSAFSDSEVQALTSDISLIEDPLPTDTPIISEIPPTDISLIVESPTTDTSIKSEIPHTETSLILEAPPTDTSIISETPHVDISLISEAPPTETLVTCEVPTTDISLIWEASPTDTSIISETSVATSLITEAPPTNAAVISETPPDGPSLIFEAPSSDALLMSEAPPTYTSVISETPPVDISLISEAPPTKTLVTCEVPTTDISLIWEASPTDTSIISETSVATSLITETPPTNTSVIFETPPDGPSLIFEAPSSDALLMSEAPPTYTSDISETPPVDISLISETPSAYPSLIFEAPPSDAILMSDAPPTYTSLISETPSAYPSLIFEAPPSDASPMSDVPPTDTSLISEWPTERSDICEASPTDIPLKFGAPPNDFFVTYESPPTFPGGDNSASIFSPVFEPPASDISPLCTDPLGDNSPVGKLPSSDISPVCEAPPTISPVCEAPPTISPAVEALTSGTFSGAKEESLENQFLLPQTSILGTDWQQHNGAPLSDAELPPGTDLLIPLHGGITDWATGESIHGGRAYTWAVIEQEWRGTGQL